MAKKLRAMVSKRKELCDRVLGALTVQGPEIGDQLGEYLTPVVAADEDLPDLSTLLSLFGRRLEGYCDAMVAADQVHLAELARLESLRDQAIEPMRGLKGSILSLRATVQGLFGRGSLPALGLDFNIARNPQGVLRQAEIIRGRLASGERALAARRWIHGYFDRDSALAELDRDIEPLRGVLARQLEQRKRIDTAKVRKDQAILAFDHHFIRVTRLVESAFRVAGETELAERIRPTVRRLGRDGGAGAGAGAGEPEVAEPKVAAGQSNILAGKSATATMDGAVGGTLDGAVGGTLDDAMGGALDGGGQMGHEGEGVIPLTKTDRSRHFFQYDASQVQRPPTNHPAERMCGLPATKFFTRENKKQW